MDLKINIAADVAAAVAHLDKTRAALSDLSDQSDLSDKNFKVTAQTQPAVNNLSKLERAAQSAVATLGKVTRTIGRTAAAGGTWLAVKSVNALKWGFAGLTAGVGAGAFALTKYGAAAEQTRLAFRTMLGSIADGDAMMAKLDRFSNSTPYSGDQVNQAAKTLLAFGVEAGDVEETLRSVGDVASGSGKDFNELAAIYGKVFAKGKMDTEAMNQMVEAGIPIVKTLGTMFGKSGNQIYEMAEKGEISAAAVDQAFKQMSGSGGVFAGMMEKQSNTLSGIWGAITGQLAYAAQNIGEAIVPALKVVMSYLQTWADKIAEMSADGSLLKYFGSIATAGVTAIGEIIKWSVTLANHFAAAFKTIGAWGEMLWNGLKLFVAYAGPEKLQHSVLQDPDELAEKLKVLSINADGFLLGWRRTSLHLFEQDEAYINYILKQVRSWNKNIAILGEAYYGQTASSNHKLRNLQYNVPANTSGVLVTGLGYNGVAVDLVLDKLLVKIKKQPKIALITGDRPYYATLANNGKTFAQNLAIKKAIADRWIAAGASGVIVLHGDGSDGIYEKEHTDNIAVKEVSP